MFRPLTGLPNPAPRRPATAIVLAAAVACLSLASAAAVWTAAAPARAGAEARLFERAGDGLADLQLLQLDALVQARFTDAALAYLALAVLFASLAVAARFGPPWSLAATGVLCAAGTLIAAYLGLGRAFGGFQDLTRVETEGWLRDAAPFWLGPVHGVPVLATAACLPLIAAILYMGRARQDHSADR